MNQPISINSNDLQLGSATARLVRWGLGVGGAGLVVALIGAAIHTNGWQRLQYAYLMTFCFFVSLALGCLFLVAVHHLTRTGWGVVVRRLAETVSMLVVPLAVAALPILLLVISGSSELFPWNNPTVQETDHLVHHKAPYLNAPFFVIRAVFYLAVWVILARYFWSRSVKQDETDDVQLTLRMQVVSAPSMFAFGLTLTFASFDWLMSLSPHWFSTIFGVYYYSGAVVGALALLIVMIRALQASGRLTQTVTVEHGHDLGKLLFGFVFFWAYIAFSQFLLIWYANIPEETFWYRVRMENGWQWVSLALLFGHFILPFLGLMSRSVKRNPRLLAGWAAFLLVMHWVDVYWLAMPAVLETPSIGLTELGCLAALGGLLVAAWAKVASKHALIPVHDPRLPESLAFHVT